jgi:hypothetical protein
MFPMSLGFRCAAAAIIVLAIFGYGVKVGVDHEEAQQQRIALANMQEQIDHAADMAHINTEVSRAYQQKLRYAETKAAQLQEKVKQYVSETADRNCVVNVGFERLHDEALGHLYVPSSTGGSNDDASGVKLSEVGARVAANYTACEANTEQLKQLQDWARRVSAQKKAEE